MNQKIYNKKVQGFHFEFSDLVLKMNYKNQQHKEKQGKFELNWDYNIEKVNNYL